MHVSFLLSFGARCCRVASRRVRPLRELQRGFLLAGVRGNHFVPWGESLDAALVIPNQCTSFVIIVSKDEQRCRLLYSLLSVLCA